MLRPLPLGSARRILVATALALSLAQILILALGLPVLRSRPGWFWPRFDTPLPAAWGILPLVALAIVLGRRLWREPERTGRNLAALVGLGFVWQVGFACMPGKGLDGLRAPLVASGHGEFVALASSDLTMREVATRYEAVLDERHMVFPRSKPPGQLLFYQALERVTGLGLPFDQGAARAARYEAVLLGVFPLLTALAVVPAYALSRRWLPPRLGLAAMGLFLLAPNTTLILMHLDGVLYPGLAATLLLSVVVAVERRSPALAGLSGFLYFLCSFLSFSLLPLAVLALAPLLGQDRPPAAALARLGLAAALGFGLPVLACALALDYDPVARFRAAITFHDQFKRLFVPGSRLDYAVSNWLDFGLWTGIPLCACFGAGLAARGADLGARLGLLLAALLFGLAWQAGTLGETARLWLFLVPPLAMVAARGLATLFPTRTGTALAVLLGWQTVITLATKRWQDFF